MVVSVGDTLCWEKQIRGMIGKAKQMTPWIITNVVSRKPGVLIPFYKDFVRPHLEYAVQVWAPTARHEHWGITRNTFCKNLAKLTGPAVRLDSKRPKGKKNDERKKKLDNATLGFETASQLRPAKKVQLLTTELCNSYVKLSGRLIVLKYLFLLFTLLNLMELYLS